MGREIVESYGNKVKCCVVVKKTQKIFMTVVTMPTVTHELLYKTVLKKFYIIIIYDL
jgi:hypothetical protein